MTTEQSRSPEAEHVPPGNIAQAQLESIPIFPTSLLRSINAKDLGIGKVRVLLKLTNSIDSSPDAKPFLSLDKRKKQVTIHDYSSRLQGSNSSSDSSPPNLASPERRPGVSAPKMFAFDGVFSPDDSLAELCTCTLLDPLRAAATGSVGCVLVYGYPKLGKSKTVIGEKRRLEAASKVTRESAVIAGVLPTALAWLMICLSEMKRVAKNRTYTVSLSAVEIVAAQGNEPRDLLRSSQNPPGTEAFREPLSIEIPDVNSGLSTLDRALARRKWVPTSHALFTFNIRIQDKLENNSSAATDEVGRLHILDLGGGDTQGRTGLSASAIGHILVAIFNGSKHLPHRENPLTSLIQKCLSSLTCQTTVIAHISAGTSHVPETMTTIQLSSRIHRLRRMKIKVPGASGSGGSSGEDSKVGRTLGPDATLLSSDVDPSSSEQSCDTVIYLGPARDDATDGEHPPVDIPPVSEGGKLKCPIATMKEKMTAVSSKGREKSADRDKRGHTVFATKPPVAHTPSPDAFRTFCSPVTSSLPGTPRKHNGGNPSAQLFFQHQAAAQLHEAAMVHGTPTRAPPHHRHSRYMVEQTMAPATSGAVGALAKVPVSTSPHSLQRRHHGGGGGRDSSGYPARSDERWIDWPKVSRNPRRAPEMLELRQLKSLPASRIQDDKARRYGYMDDHKKSMIEQWVETQTQQLRAHVQPHDVTSVSSPIGDRSWFEAAPETEKLLHKKRDISPAAADSRRRRHETKSSQYHRNRHHKKEKSCRRHGRTDERQATALADASTGCREESTCKSLKHSCCHGCCPCCTRQNNKHAATQQTSAAVETLSFAAERTSKPISVVSPKVKVETTFPARENATILVHEIGSGTAVTNSKIGTVVERPSPPSLPDVGQLDELSFGSLSIAVRGGDGDEGSIEDGSESLDYACSSNDVLETIEVPERDEPVPMQDMSIQVTEQDIALCLGLENPLPESDQEGALGNSTSHFISMPSVPPTHFSTMALYEAHVELPDHTQLSEDLSQAWRDDYFAKRFPLPPMMPKLSKTAAIRPFLLDPFDKSLLPSAWQEGDERGANRKVDESRLSSCSFPDCKLSSPKTVTPVSSDHPGFSLSERGAQFDTELRDKLSRLYSKLRHPDGASNPNIFARTRESTESNLSSACSEPAAREFRKGDRNSQGSILFSSSDFLGPRTVIGQDSATDLLKNPLLPKELDHSRMAGKLSTHKYGSRSLERPVSTITHPGAEVGSASRPKTSRRRQGHQHHNHHHHHHLRSARSNKPKGLVQATHGESSGYESIVRDSDCSSVVSSCDGSDRNDADADDRVGGAVEILQYARDDISKMELRADMCLDVMRRVAKLRKRQEFLKKELAAAKKRLSIPQDRWSFDLYVAEQLGSRPDPGLVDALEQETRILEKRVAACQSHLLLVTCFDATSSTAKTASGATGFSRGNEDERDPADNLLTC